MLHPAGSHNRFTVRLSWQEDGGETERWAMATGGDWRRTAAGRITYQAPGDEPEDLTEIYAPLIAEAAAAGRQEAPYVEM